MKNKLIVAGLKAALPRLAMSYDEERNWREKEKDTYICYAIGIACVHNECTNVEAHSAREHITKMLNGSVHVGEYLQEVVKVPRRQLTDRNVQLFRKRWVEHMIAEFS